MDELEFRRQAYSNPGNKTADFLTSMAEEEGRESLVNDLKQLDKRINKALQIELPEGLPERLILRQQLSLHQRRRKFTQWGLALAASVSLFIGMNLGWMHFGPVDLAEHALVHIYHEKDALLSDDSVPLGELNSSLKRIKGLEQAHFSASPGDIVYKADCDFQGVRSLHLVLENTLGKVTLFIVPLEERMQLHPQFADSKFQGRGLKTKDAFLLLVGEHAAALNQAEQAVLQSFI